MQSSQAWEKAMHLPFTRTSGIRSIAVAAAWFLVAGSGIAQSPESTSVMQVESVSGSVRYRSSSPWLVPGAGQVIKLSAVVSTGSDGDIKLRQDNTVIALASNTALEIHPGSEPGSPVQRVVQEQGSAFYDIETRESGKMRVETPYLVAVIKGTQFNVTSDADSTTISLFEGRLQVEAPDIGDVVDLYAGQIARRHKDDTRIQVLGMSDGEPVARDDARSSSSKQGDGDDSEAERAGAPQSIADGTADAGLRVGGNGVEGGADVGLNLPGASAGVGTEVAVGSGKISLGTDANVALSEFSVNAGLDTTISANGDLIGAAVDTGIAPIDAGLDAGVDVGTGTIEADLGASVADLDLGLELGIDTGDPLDLGLDELLDETDPITEPIDDITDNLPDLGGLLGR